MQTSLTFPKFSDELFPKVKEYYSKNELKNTNRLISYLYKSRAGLKGEITKLKKTHPPYGKYKTTR